MFCLSYRRSLSFSEHEKDLVDYFDENGKSDIAKEALKNHMNKDSKNNDIVLSDEFHEALMKLFEKINICDWNNFNNQPKDEIKSKIAKLIKK